MTTVAQTFDKPQKRVLGAFICPHFMVLGLELIKIIIWVAQLSYGNSIQNLYSRIQKIHLISIIVIVGHIICSSRVFSNCFDDWLNRSMPREYDFAFCCRPGTGNTVQPREVLSRLSHIDLILWQRDLTQLNHRKWCIRVANMFDKVLRFVESTVQTHRLIYNDLPSSCMISLTPSHPSVPDSSRSDTDA